MIKSIKKLTLLLLMAAPIVLAASCSKDDDKTPTLDEAYIKANIIGKWHIEQLEFIVNGHTYTQSADEEFKDYNTYVFKDNGVVLGGKATDDESSMSQWSYTVSGTRVTMVVQGSNQHLDVKELTSTKLKALVTVEGESMGGANIYYIFKKM